MTTPDPFELKQQQRDNWKSVAEGWRRQDDLLRKGAAPVTNRMLELTRISSGSRLLDIASGTGEPAITAAHIVGDSGQVIGTDLVDEMLAVAREKTTEQKLNNIEFHCVDAETLDYPAASFDAVTIRWGLMFMPQPLDCLTAAHATLKQNGRISLACWAAPQKTPFINVLLETLSHYMKLPVAAPGTPGIFAFADPERLHVVLESAGFNNIKLEEMEINVIEVYDGHAYWEAMSDLAAPVMALVNQLEQAARQEYIDEVISAAESFKQSNTLCMKGTTWIASATK
ncbi:MAG TPA: methyltransferase domain-containing protein [Crenotrichaceae bacterium]|nr:methyltransferase domain-containing protein [Crenotrichaceae bacterium]